MKIEELERGKIEKVKQDERVKATDEIENFKKIQTSNQVDLVRV